MKKKQRTGVEKSEIVFQPFTVSLLRTSERLLYTGTLQSPSRETFIIDEMAVGQANLLELNAYLLQIVSRPLKGMGSHSMFVIQ